MGRNVNAAIIKPQADEAVFPEILAAIGFPDCKFSAVVPFGYEVERDHEHLYIGNYNGATIVYNCITLAGKPEANGLSKTENRLIGLFPDQKKIIFEVADAAPAYYVHVIESGKTQRIKGSSPDGQMPETGEESAFEKSCYQSRHLNEEGLYVCLYGCQ